MSFGERNAGLQCFVLQVDTHPTVIARDLVILYALDELSLLEPENKNRADQLCLMLYYMYVALIMPPAAHEVMMESIQSTTNMLRAGIATASTSPGVTTVIHSEWLHVDIETAKKALASLEWWLGKRRDPVLPQHMVPDRLVVIQTKRKTLNCVCRMAMEAAKGPAVLESERGMRRVSTFPYK